MPPRFNPPRNPWTQAAPLARPVLSFVALLFVACGGSYDGPGVGDGEGGERIGVAGRSGWGEGGTGDQGTAGASGATGKAGSGVVLMARPRGGAPGTGGVVGVGGGQPPMAGTGGVAGGRGGSIGRGGSPGRGGSGGQPTCGQTERPTRCPATLCGNGVRESCVVKWGTYPSCSQSVFYEDCDGKDLGFQQTCDSLEGFASGTLRCSPSCTRDTRGCSECTTEPAIIRCGVSPLPFAPDMVALGASEREIGVVTATFRDDYVFDVSFTRLAETLDGLSVTPIIEPALQKPDDFGYLPLQSLIVAPLPSGWVIGLFAGTKLYVHVLDAAGEDVRRWVIDNTQGYGYFVPRPDGGPLLVWVYSQSGYYGTVDLRASVIATDGSAMTTPIVLPGDNRSLVDVGSGAYLAGAFYLPFTIADGYGDPQLRIARIGTDGALAARISALSGQTVLQPNLTAGHGRLQLNYTGLVGGYYYYETRLLWQTLTTTGELSGAPVPVELSGSGLAGWPFSFSVAGDTVFLIQGVLGDSIELLRLDEAGGVASHSQIVRPTFRGFEWFAAVPRGPDVVLGWFVAGSHQLRLARVTP